MARKYKAVIDTPHRPRTCFQVTVPREGKNPLVARFGGIPLKRQLTAVIDDRRPPRMTSNELIRRILAGQCERCQARTGLHVHHVRRLADLEKPGRLDRPDWIRLMAQRKRKTLVVCRQCHQDIHAGRATATTRSRHWRAVCEDIARAALVLTHFEHGYITWGASSAEPAGSPGWADQC
jgi:hypothetical protein